MVKTFHKKVPPLPLYGDTIGCFQLSGYFQLQLYCAEMWKRSDEWDCGRSSDLYSTTIHSSRYVFNSHRICIHSTSLSSVISLGLRTLRAFVHPKKFSNQHLMYSTVFNEHIKHSTIHSHSICSKDMEIHLQNIYDHRHRVSAVCVFFGRARLTLTPSAH